ncbi:phage terminase small subunit [Pseudomonas monteilii]|uniref:phage terminase small subunit n=1 Tax=Pseudomonas monteilii TaxID=76759 RepID=UPI00383A92BD
MTNPCRRHYQRITAAIAAAAAAPDQTMEGATAYEMQLAQLHQDRLRLSGIQSREGKGKLKVELLPAYEPYVSGVLAAGLGAQDEVMTTIMVWRFDASEWAGGLDIATYVLQHALKMPDRFERTTGCIVAEEIAEAALKAQKTGETFPINILTRTAELTEDQDMPDQARAKLMLALGKATLTGLDDANPGQPGQIRAGVDLLRRAIELHDSCGGKKDLERAERLLKKPAGPAG